jgi:predicted alternative tryptophan synthase beta-subunit
MTKKVITVVQNTGNPFDIVVNRPPPKRNINTKDLLAKEEERRLLAMTGSRARTSAAAHANAKETAPTKRQVVLEWFIDQARAALGLPYGTVGPRINELVQVGCLKAVAISTSNAGSNAKAFEATGKALPAKIPAKHERTPMDLALCSIKPGSTVRLRWSYLTEIVFHGHFDTWAAKNGVRVEYSDDYAHGYLEVLPPKGK